VARFHSRLYGPLMDCIDLQVEVAAAAACQQGRQGVPNARLEAATLEAHAALAPSAAKFLTQAGTRLGWSGCGLHRALKVARTIADLAGSPAVEVVHVAEALQYRRALPGA